jgi:hypothetical protein
MTDDSASGSTKTFTQADLDRAAAAGAQRERQRAAEKYADYDDLKAKADAAAANESKLDKLVTQVEALTGRAEKAETENLRRTVADEFGLTAREARRLSGKTADELRADAEEMVEDLGIDVKARKAGKAGTTAPKGEATDGETEGGETAQDDEETPATSRQTPPAARMRPRENLRSGAPRTETAPVETNPLKLVENIPRR